MLSSFSTSFILTYVNGLLMSFAVSALSVMLAITLSYALLFIVSTSLMILAFMVG